jgi:hypothetical protein
MKRKKKVEIATCNKCGRQFEYDGFVKCGICAFETISAYKPRSNTACTPTGGDSPASENYSLPGDSPLPEKKFTPPTSG